MKSLFVLIVSCPLFVFAQSVNVKDIKGDEDGTTTIQIKKSKNDVRTDVLWEVVEGSADIEGEPAALNKEARASWKTACDEWKKEFRADNKENKIISMSCGTPACAGEVANKICSSKATYKVKTKIN